MGLRRQKAGQKRGEMIPLMQHFTGWPGTVPPPAMSGSAETVADPEAFALLMDQPVEVPTDAAEVLAMMAQMPLQPVPAHGPADGPPVEVTIAALEMPGRPQPTMIAATVPEGAVTPPAKTTLPIPKVPEASQPLFPDPLPVEVAPVPVPPSSSMALPEQAKLTEPPPNPQSADFDIVRPTRLPMPKSILPNASDFTLPGQSAQNPAPGMTQASVGENAFLARIEPKLEAPLPASIMPIADAKSTLMAAVVVAPNGTSVAGVMPRTPAIPRSEPEARREEVSHSTVRTITTALVMVPAMPDNRVVESVTMQAGAEVVLDAITRSEPQAFGVLATERIGGPPPTAAIPLPPAVPAALIVHAPAAANGPVEVVLNPEELGKIRFEIHQYGDQVKVVLAVERPETLDLLRRHADQLVQEFRAAGFAGASLGFGHWGGQQGADSAEIIVSDPDGPTTEPSPALRPTPQNQNIAPSQGLNLRL